MTKPSHLSSSAASFGGDEADTVVAAVEPVEPPYLHNGETCALTSVVPNGFPSNCRFTRSCRSCLQKASCMINQYGACVDQFAGRYSTWMNYSIAYSMGLVLPNATTTQAASSASTQNWAFRAFEANYCASSDSVCQECIKRNFWSSLSRPDSRFCEGKNGCVCIFNCEAQWNTPEVQCVSASSMPSVVTYEPSEKGLSSVVKVMVLGMCVILLLFAACLFRCIRKDYDNRQRQDQQRRSAREAAIALRAQQRQQRLEKLGVSALSLSGWQSFRQSLIDKEKQRVHEADCPSTIETGSNALPSPSAIAYVLSIDDSESVDGGRPSSAPVTNSVRPANSSGHMSTQ